MRQINQAGLDLIKSFEGLKLKAYKDSVGILTIGFGHTGPDVHQGLVINASRAEELLRNDLAEAETGVEKTIRIEVTDDQFAACVSLAFNVGVNAFDKSTLAHLINIGRFDLAADQFLRWNRAGGKVLAGLTRRRTAERGLFLTVDSDKIEDAS